MTSTDTAVLNGMILYHKFLAECYSLYSDARTKLGPYRVMFNKGFEREYPEFMYDSSRGKIDYEKFTKCVKTVKEFLILFPFLKADY